MSYPIPGPNLSDTDRELFLEEYGGEVESQFKKSSIMRQYAKVRPVRGTDTIVNNRVGRTTLKMLQPGVRPPAESTPFGKVSLTVDTVVLADDNRTMLNEFQTHFDARMDLAQINSALVIQGYAAAVNGPNIAIVAPDTRGYTITATDDAGDLNINTTSGVVPRQEDLPPTAVPNMITRVATESDPDDGAWFRFVNSGDSGGVLIGQ